MPDWGTLVADSKGVLHDLALESFDTLSKNVRQPLNSTDKLLTDSFTTTYKKLKTHIQGTLGLDPEEGISLENIARQVGSQLKSQATRIGVEAAVGFAASKAASLEGPLGMLLSEAVTIATSEFAAYFLDKQHFKTGQWVFLDYGTQTRHINDNPKVVQLSQGFDMFSSSSYTIIPDELDYSVEAKHSIGFILGQDESTYEWNVFSFLTGREERIHEEKIRACPVDFAARLDANSDFSKVREVLFLKDHDPTLRTYIPTEPGQTVWLAKEPYTILEQSGDEWVLEANDGRHIRAHESDLSPGKTTSNTTWDHDSIHLGGYRTSDAIYSGQWVWIPAGDMIKNLIHQRRRMSAVVPDVFQQMGPDNKVLALVKSVEGKTVHLVRAYDGELVDIEQPNVVGTSNTIGGLLDHNEKLSDWKEMTLDGYNPKFQLPGKSQPMLTLGLGLYEGEELHKMAPVTKRPQLEARSTIKEPITSTSGASDLVSKRYKINLEDEAQNDAALTGIRANDVTEIILEKSTGPSISGSGGPLMVLLAVGVAWAFFA